MKVTLEKEEIQQIDWSKQQLVISSDGECLVLTDCEHNDIHFSGLCLAYVSLANPYYIKTWSKRDFKPFKGTISND